MSSSQDKPTVDAYRRRTPSSEAAHGRAVGRIAQGMSRQTLAHEPYPFYAARASAQWVTDLDGNRYRDFSNNYTSLIHGHAHAPTSTAVTAVLEGHHALGAPSVLEEQLAAELQARMPALEWVRFTTSGTEAVAYAVRIARTMTGRQRVLKFEGGFHGSSGDVLRDVGNEPLPAGEAIEARPSSDGLEPASTITAVYNDIDSVRAAFERWGEEIAVVVLEPFLGNCALIDATADFARTISELAREHGALVLADEIQGVRVDPRGAHHRSGIEPDLITVGKIIGGGQPLAAFGGAAHVRETLESAGVLQTGTFTASPIALAAGLATLADFGPDEQRRLDDLGEKMRSGLRDALSESGVAGAVGGRGSMFHISLGTTEMRTYRDFRTSDAEGWSRLHLALLGRGIFLMKRGTGCVSTPMDIADVDALTTSLREELMSI